LFGWFSLQGERLVFETNSAERAERGRRLVERVAGDFVKYRVTRTEDLAQAMMAMRERGAGAVEAPGSLPPELRETGSAAVDWDGAGIFPATGSQRRQVISHD
jgi:hypothetical protein